MLKSTVLDPQGQTIQRALSSLGYSKVQDVRQGKFFVLALDGLSREEAKSRSNASPKTCSPIPSSKNSASKSSSDRTGIRLRLSELSVDAIAYYAGIATASAGP